ncbi:MAG: serine hydrolase domain-containing protein, partial [Bacteroidota bacterium]
MKKTFIAIIICAWMTRGYAQLDTTQISAELSGWIKEKNLPGMVLYIKKGDQVLLHQAFGHSNKEEKIPMKVKQRFRIFSMSKPITSLALMNCLSENNLTTDHLMTDIFPSFKSDHPISIQQVMTHTAGFSYGGEFSWTGLQYWWYDPLEKSDDLDELMDRLSGLPLNYKPGEGWEYSLSHDVQGAIIEQVSTKTFPEYLQRKLLGTFH